MPAVSAGDQATLDTFPQGTKLGMAIFQPETIVTGRVSGSPATGATTVVLTGKVEDEGPEANFTVYAGSAAGLSDGGKARLKSLSGSTMTLAPNFIQWTTYDYITIKKVIEPWAILPDIENDFEDANVSYTNQNDEYHPLGRIGPLGIVGTTDVAVKFWSSSYAVAAGASLSSHAWVFPDGSPGSSASAGTSGSPISVTWDTATGHTPKYVKYTVTDDNGKTHIRRIPVWIFDDINDSHCDIEVDSMSGSFDSGSWRASIKALGDADIAMFPQDAMIVVFAEDHYAGHRTEIGGNWAHQENIVFAGWIAEDSVQRDKDLGFVTFEVLGPVDKMKELLCWPANLERKNSPDTWHELRGMTSDLAAFHVWTEHTTMEAICDFLLTGNTKKFLYVDIPEADPHNQIQDYCLKPIGANLLSDRQGRVYLDLNPNLMPVSDRSGIATTLTMTIDSPIRNDPGLTLAMEDHAEDVAQIDFVAFGYTGEDPKPYYSLAPGNQHSTGDVQKVDGIRADSQAESNTLSGLYLAEANNVWREVKAPMFNWRVFDIAPQEYTELTLVAADTKRGLVWDAQKLICRAVEIAYDHEGSTLYVTPSFEKDSFGPAGITGDYPDEPPPNDGGGVSPIPGLPPTSAANPRDLLIGDDTNGVWWLPVGGTLWDNRSGPDLNVEQLGWDPWWFTEQKKATSNPEEAIIWTVHEGDIYRSTNLGQAWLLQSVGSDPPNAWGDAVAPTFADLTFVQRTDNIHKNKHHYFLGIWAEAGGEWRTWVLRTEDDGASWSWTSLSSVSSDDDGYVYATAYLSNDCASEHCLVVGAGNPGQEGAGGTHLTKTDVDDLCYASCTHVFDMGQQVTATDGKVRIKSGIYHQPWGPGPCPSNSIKKALWAYTTQLATNEAIDAGVINTDVHWMNTIAGDEYPASGWTVWSGTFNGAFRYIGLSGEWGSYDYPDCTNAKAVVQSIQFENIDIPSGKGLWMDVDSEDGSIIYITVWNTDETLSVQKRTTADMGLVSTTALGACTEAELDAGTYVAYPYTPTFNKDRVYIFGRMTAPALLAGIQHLIQSADGSTTFTSAENGLGTSVLTNFRAEGEADGARTFYGIVSAAAAAPQCYRGVETLASVSTLSDLPNGLVNVDAFAIRIDPDSSLAVIGVGSPSAQAVMVVQTEDDGATWADTTLNLPTTGAITTCVFV